MNNARIISGRLVGPTRVELSEPIEGVEMVEVIVRGATTVISQGSLADFIASLPPGTRSREDIDRQVAEERDSWGDEQ